MQAIVIAFSTRFTQKFNAVAVTIQLVGMIGLVVLLFAFSAFNNELNFAKLFSTGSIPAEDYYAFGELTKVGQWIMGTLLGAFTIVALFSAAALLPALPLAYKNRHNLATDPLYPRVACH